MEETEGEQVRISLTNHTFNNFLTNRNSDPYNGKHIQPMVHRRRQNK